MDTLITFTQDLPRATIARRVAEGSLRRLAPGIYSSDVRTPAAELIATNWKAVAAHEVPDAVIVDRSAIAGRPEDGHLFVDAGPGAERRALVLPGLTIHRRTGPGALDGDVEIHPGLWLSSQPRALADNTRPSRRSARRPASTLDDRELADWIDHLALAHRPESLVRLRSAAEALAQATGTEQTVGRASELLGAALGTRTAQTDSPALAARQAGRPYDHRRIEVFDVLVDHLRSEAPSPIEASGGAARHLPFYEAYFSNFIEGTVLTLDEAEAVMHRNEDLPSHPEDAHDVLATYRLAIDPATSAAVPTTASELTELLQHRHRLLMEARPDKHPGHFKQIANRVGAHTFVAPDLVLGTLAEGWARIAELSEPFDRAVAMMFVVAEVHPFDDGNGRVARLMMNAELSSKGESRIIVPPVYRGEYLSALSALSANGRPRALSRVLAFAQRWTAQIDFSDQVRAVRQMTATHAFLDTATAQEHGTKLRLLSAIPADELDDSQ